MQTIIFLLLLFSVCNTVNCIPWQRIQSQSQPIRLQQRQPIFSPNVDFSIAPGQDFNTGLEIGRQRSDISTRNANFIQIPLRDGRSVQVPKGFYYYTEDENEIKSEIDLPNTNNPLEWFARLIDGDSGFMKKDVDLTGIYLPLPHGMAPIDLQFMIERENGLSLGGGLGLDDANGQLQNNFFARLLRDSILSSSTTTTTRGRRQNDRRRKQQRSYSAEKRRIVQNAMRICASQGQYACDMAKRRLRLLLGQWQGPSSNQQPGVNLANNLFASYAPSLFGLPSLLDQSTPNTNTDPMYISAAEQPSQIGGGHNSRLNANGLAVVLGVPGVDPVYVKSYLSENNRLPLTDGF